MERLTSSDIDYCERYCDMDKNRCSIYSSCIMRKSFQKLKEYEDLEEQGLLLRLPCKVGDAVYEITGTTTRGYDWKYLTYEKAYVCETVFNLSRLNDIGKTVFLTQTEAEQKLKEMLKEMESD